VRVEARAVALVALALVACGRSSSEPEPSPSEDPGAAPAPLRPEAAAAEQRLGSTLARFGARERAAAFQRCPPADERFDAAMAALAEAAATCVDGGDAPAACDLFVERVGAPPPETIGCRYADPPVAGEGPGTTAERSPQTVTWRALSRVVARARDQSPAEAARLTARALRLGALLLRTDDARGWIGVGDLAPWITRLVGWVDGLPEDAADAVRKDLEATRGAWLDAELAPRLLLLREVDRGRATGGLEGDLHEEAALVTLEALAAGSDVASLRSEIDAMASDADGAMRAFAAQPGPPRDPTPRERGLFLIVSRQRLVRELDAVMTRHQKATEALALLPR